MPKTIPNLLPYNKSKILDYSQMPTMPHLNALIQHIFVWVYLCQTFPVIILQDITFKVFNKGKKPQYINTNKILIKQYNDD